MKMAVAKIIIFTFCLQNITQTMKLPLPSFSEPVQKWLEEVRQNRAHPYDRSRAIHLLEGSESEESILGILNQRNEIKAQCEAQPKTNPIWSKIRKLGERIAIYVLPPFTTNTIESNKEKLLDAVEAKYELDEILKQNNITLDSAKAIYDHNDNEAYICNRLDAYHKLPDRALRGILHDPLESSEIQDLIIFFEEKCNYNIMLLAQKYFESLCDEIYGQGYFANVCALEILIKKGLNLGSPELLLRAASYNGKLGTFLVEHFAFEQPVLKMALHNAIFYTVNHAKSKWFDFDTKMHFITKLIDTINDMNELTYEFAHLDSFVARATKKDPTWYAGLLTEEELRKEQKNGFALSAEFVQQIVKLRYHKKILTHFNQQQTTNYMSLLSKDAISLLMPYATQEYRIKLKELKEESLMPEKCKEFKYE